MRERGLDQLVCDGKTLRGSAVETEDCNHCLYPGEGLCAQTLALYLAQKTYHSGEFSERAFLLAKPSRRVKVALSITRPFLNGLVQGGYVLLTNK